MVFLQRLVVVQLTEIQVFVTVVMKIHHCSLPGSAQSSRPTHLIHYNLLNNYYLTT